MPAKRLVAGALAGATALAVIGGCARQIQVLEPKLELRNAAHQLGAAQQAGFVLTLTGNPADLIAAVQLHAKNAKDTAGPSAEDTATLRRLFNSSVTVAYDKAGAGTKDDRSMIAVTVDGVGGSEFRTVDGSLYAKAPVAELAAKLGASSADVASMRRQAVSGLPSAAALFDGKWVSLSATDLAALASASAGQGKQDLQQAKALKELTAGAQNLLQGATIVRDKADSTHLVVTSSTTAAFAEAKRVAAALEPAFADSLPPAPKDRPIVLDLWVKGGKLTAAEVNILQFIDGATGRVAVRLEVTAGVPIAAPDGATRIDLTELRGRNVGGGGRLKHATVSD